MSLPPNMKEELLSAYLDDALSGDERRRVEQVLDRDEEARTLLEQLTALQKATRAALQDSPTAPADLAQRVLVAAQQQAAAEALPATHHVRAGAQGPGGHPFERPDDLVGPRWQPLGIALAMAAALLVAVTLWQMPFGGSTDGPSVAQPNAAADPATQPDGSAAGPSLAEAEPEKEGTPDALSPDRIAGTPAEPVADAAGASPDGPSLEAMEAGPKGANDEVMRVADASPATTPPGSAALESAPLSEDPTALLASQAVMLFEVEETDLGRENRAVFQAMQEAGIQPNGTQAVNEAVVGYLQEAELVGGTRQDVAGAAGPRPVSIVYVEASGKQLDRFMVSLFANTEEIGRIGWNLAMDAPVVAATQAIGKAVPTEVQATAADGAAWQIVSSEAERRFANAENERPFLPIDRRDPEAWQGSGSASLGADIRSRLLILIR